jgi:hypothetical protein
VVNDRAATVTLPARALFTEGDKTYAFLAAGDGHFERRLVVASTDGNGRRRVASGIRAGDRVVAAARCSSASASNSSNSRSEVAQPLPRAARKLLQAHLQPECVCQQLHVCETTEKLRVACYRPGAGMRL